MKSLKKIDEKLWCLELPLPNNPLRSINVYVVPDDERPLVIDVGLDAPGCLELLQEGLAQLGVAPSRTDFILTHMHIDHIGLVSKIVEPGSRVFMGSEDVDLLDWWPGWEGVAPLAEAQGFPAHELLDAVHADPVMNFNAPTTSGITRLDGTEVFEAGGYRWELIHTPGHTDGHMCLYDRQKGVFVAGDHILGDITPNIQGWNPKRDRLREYMESLEAVAKLEVELLLPGHRKPVADHRARAGELIGFHHERLEEVRALIRGRELTGYEVASQMNWDMTFTDWAQWPVTQRWFATGEALSHLRWLAFNGEAREIEREGLSYYTL